MKDESMQPLALEGLAAASLLIEAEVANLRWFAREMVSVEGCDDAGKYPRYVLELNGNLEVLTRTAAYTELVASVPMNSLPTALAITLADRREAHCGAVIAYSVGDPTRRALYIGAILAFESVVLNREGRQLDVCALLDAIPQPQREEVERLLEFLSALNEYVDVRGAPPLLS